MGLNDKRYLSANEFLLDSWKLAAAVRNAGWKPDVLIALWRGGAPVGVAVHEYLMASGWMVEHFPVKCASYTGIGRNEGEVVFSCEEPVFEFLKKGTRVLVVDDVFDTGKSAAAMKARLDPLGVEVRFACVYWKPEKNQTNLKPDYFTKDVGREWIVFPHEIEGLSPAEIAEKDPTLAALLK